MVCQRRASHSSSAFTSPTNGCGPWTLPSSQLVAAALRGQTARATLACCAPQPTRPTILAGPATTSARPASSESGPRPRPKCSEDLLADMDKLTLTVAQARAAVEGLQHSAVELTLQRCCLNNSKTSHLLRCNGDRVDSGRLLRFDEGMVGGAGLCTGRPSPRRQYKRLCRLMLEDSACEKRAPSPCPPSRLAPWLPKCANTLPLQASAPLRSLCRPTTPVLLRHGLCGCRVSPKLCTARDLVQRRWESFVRGCQAAAETTGGPPALAPGGRLIAALRTEDVERPHTRTANGACSPAAHAAR